MMQWWKLIVLVVIAIIFVWGLYIVIVEKNALHGEISSLSEKVSVLEEENRSLEFDIEYFSHPENILKELKSKFNYREEGEHLIILVPRNASSSNALESGGQ